MSVLAGEIGFALDFGVGFGLTGTLRGHRDGILELELFWERTVAGNVCLAFLFTVWSSHMCQYSYAIRPQDKHLLADISVLVLSLVAGLQYDA